MNQSGFAKALSKKTGLSNATAYKVVKAGLSIIESNTKNGKKTSFPGFGNFTKNHRNARKGRNPQTGKPLKIAARDVPHFKAGSTFKHIVNA